jgi:formylglycine-generating enzyme required for sulfatase activity
MPLQLAGVQYIDITQSPNDIVPVIERVRQNFRLAPSSTSVGAAPAPSDLPVRRRVSVSIIAIGLALLLIAGVVFFVLPSLTEQNRPTPTNDAFGLARATQTESAAQTRAAIPVETGNPALDVQPTVDAINTQDASTLAANDDFQAGRIRVTRNPAWMPVEQDFDGVPMVLVPAGCFRMGNDPEANYGVLNAEGVPDGGVQCFDTPFWIDKYEVSNFQFLEKGGYAAMPSVGSGSQPRDTITWFEARDFCELRGARLPTEREWEYAARGPDNLFFPWGNELVLENVVAGLPASLDVGSRLGGASWVGAQDLSGNISEWTSTIHTTRDFSTSTAMPDLVYHYPYTPDDGRERDTENIGDLRVTRGGSWSFVILAYETGGGLRSASRSGRQPNNPPAMSGTQVRSLGFRCAQSVTPPPPVLGG